MKSREKYRKEALEWLNCARYVRSKIDHFTPERANSLVEEYISYMRDSLEKGELSLLDIKSSDEEIKKLRE